MKIDEIKEAVRTKLGVADFNPMQTAVAASRGNRLVLLSPTGSGKTVAFAVAMLARIKAGEPAPAAVVIAPSRELVRQIHDVVRPVASTFGMKTVALYGGNSFSGETDSIGGAMPDIIVATPGRLLDHINRGTLDVAGVRAVVLDEYDKTLELGFHDEIRRIARKIGMDGAKKRFVMVTSATRLTEVPEFIDMADAEIIDYTPQSTVEQRLRIVNVPSPGRDKLETLAALIRSIADKGRCIVFVNHRESADRVGEYLKKQHISAVVYHGGLDQQKREMALARFDSDAARVLVSTDLAGRGLDIAGVQSVIHYHPAADEQIWTHRNGRTARIDRTGEVYVITSPDEDVAPFVSAENDWYPDMTSTRNVPSPMTLLYIGRGKRDKISRGDIAGFVMKQAGVPAGEVGKITVGGAYSLVAVSPQYAGAVINAARTAKLKNTRVAVTKVD